MLPLMAVRAIKLATILDINPVKVRQIQSGAL